MNNENTEFISTMYKEVAQNMRFLSEWRFKSIIRYIITLTALLAMSGWMIIARIDIADYWYRIQFVPYLLISIITIAFIFLELRNSKLQNLIIKTGYDIETKFTEVIGIFEGMKKVYSSKNYTFLLKWVYIAISIISFMVSVFLFINNKAWLLSNEIEANNIIPVILLSN